MNWRRDFNLWHIILLAANCLLLWGIVQIWWDDSAVPVSTRPGRGPELPVAPILRDQEPMTTFQVVAAKDLFSQDRKGPETTQTVKAETSLAGRKLLGTMIIGSERVALISAKAGAVRTSPLATQVDVVRQGEDWEGFKVLEISSEAVVLQGKDGKKTLNFPE